MKKNKRFHYFYFFVIVFVLGLMNMYGTGSPTISLLVALFEYGIVIFFLMRGNYSKSFFYYIAFSATILEFDLYIYGEDASGHVRYSFDKLPLFKNYLRWLLAYIYVALAFNEYVAKKYVLSRSMMYLRKWLKILFVSGVISIIIALIFNDNGVFNNSNVYPEVAILNILQFLVKASIILTAVFLWGRDGWREQCSYYLQLILISVALITVVAAMIGFVGQYNGRETILLAPLAVALTPMLIMFIFKRNETLLPIVTVLSGVAAIIASIIYGGTAIGSKWYIILFLAVMGLIIMLAKIKSIWALIVGAVIFLMIVPFIILPVVSLFDANSYAAIKLDQALSTINVFGAENTVQFFADMNASPLQRFDELHNILIEYTHKPWFALFGKGIGGTTRHYTTLLSWNGLEDFSTDQIRMGAFYRMHESLAVIFLQHGIIGLLFFFKIIGMLLKRLYITPWAMMGLIWMFFYWEYGVSLIIGAVIVVLALSEEPSINEKYSKNKNKRKSVRSAPYVETTQGGGIVLY